MPEITYRPAGRGDVELIMQFIRDLAEYERLADRVAADADVLADWLFEKRVAEVVFAVCDGVEAGFALYFHNFSTFLGRAGIYLEDLFVLPEERGKGYGEALLRGLARVTLERGCGRLEWSCLDWNQPSIDFYTKKMHAAPMDEWTTYRLTGKTLEEAAQ